MQKYTPDCRNDYESDLGTFQGAVPLGTKVFSESWDQLHSALKNVPKDTPIYTFCTGGIRCVKVLNVYVTDDLCDLYIIGVFILN